MFEQRRLHFAHAVEVAVVRHRDAAAGKLEGMDVLLRDDAFGVEVHAAHVREQAGRANLLGEPLQVTVVDGKLSGGVTVRPVGIGRALVPRLHAEAREVQQGQHLRHVRLLHQRRIRLEQEVVQQDGLPQVRESSTHIWRGNRRMRDEG